MTKILINAANLHHGGGVQVAASFIEELPALLSDGFLSGAHVSIFSSTEVNNNLSRSLVESMTGLIDFQVLDIRGASSVTATNYKKYAGFDICFTIFGPMYLPLKSCYRICGFAQPMIAYQDNVVYDRLTWYSRLLSRLKFMIQSRFYRQNERLIVELGHVKKSLVAQGLVPECKIEVVENSFSSIYLDQSCWKSIDFDFSALDETTITLGFLGRGYIHKNLQILPRVSEVLRSKYGLACNFLLTLEPSEMMSLGLEGVRGFHSVGTISVLQCPDFYSHIDALLFPSLLECFSATPLEAMVMKTPVLASDREFVRDVCGDHALYFDPLSAEDIARVVSETFTDRARLVQVVNAAYHHVLGLPTAKDRARRYVELIEEAVAS